MLWNETNAMELQQAVPTEPVTYEDAARKKSTSARRKHILDRHPVVLG